MDPKKRSREEVEEKDGHARKRQCPSLLSDLTNVLMEIKQTPSSGEISAELLETMKDVMLQIDRLSNDKSNPEAQHIKDESERCLESWLDDLVAQCQADGVLFDDFGLSHDDEALALALALEEHDHHDEEEDDEEEIVIIDDEEDNQTKIRLVA